MSYDRIVGEQQAVCGKFGSSFLPSSPIHKVGVAKNVQTGLLPINGLRHPPSGDTTGWYIWAGEELSEAEDFFQPLHVLHLDDICPEIQKFLGLEPGWRFLKAGDYEDVWFDERLLSVD